MTSEAAYTLTFVWPMSFALMRKKAGKGYRRGIIPLYWGVHNLKRINGFKVNPKRFKRNVAKYRTLGTFFEKNPSYEEKMGRYWPNYIRGSITLAKKFWTNQMTTHGIFSGLSPTKYVRALVNVAKKLQKEKFFPTKKEDPTKIFGSGGQFTVAKWADAFTFKVSICVKKVPDINLPIIHEVKVFLDKNFDTIAGKGEVIGKWDPTQLVLLPVEF